MGTGQHFGEGSRFGLPVVHHAAPRSNVVERGRGLASVLAPSCVKDFPVGPFVVFVGMDMMM